MNTYRLEGVFKIDIKSDSYNEAVDTFYDNFYDEMLSIANEVYIEYVTEYDEDGNVVKEY